MHQADSRIKTDQIVIMRFLPLFLFVINTHSYGLNRLLLFRQYHQLQNRLHRAETGHMSNQMDRMQRKLLGLKRVCSSKTCSKCLKLLNTPSSKIRRSCNILVRMPGCCPQKLFSPNGF